MLTLTDLDAIGKIAKENGCVHVVDATFATPVMLRPLDHAVDMVIQSLTKYYEGHDMMTGGAVISKTKAKLIFLFINQHACLIVNVAFRNCTKM